MESAGSGMKILLLTLCLFALVDYGETATTWLYYFTSTTARINFPRIMATYGTWPGFNFTTRHVYWDVTTTTYPPTTSTIPVTEELVTTPPKEPEVIESTDTIFLTIITIACIIGLILYSCLVFYICKMMNKKQRKTKRMRVKPLKAEQAFATVMNPGIGMMGMDPTGMVGLMPPMDTGLMGMPGSIDPFTGMDPNAMAGVGAVGAAVCMDPTAGGEKQWMG
ncbi:uncharacterized protein LOC143280637 [Babylonia areolata]|uniref:uncharacterized protein LOC143280637 n=1 Tax=Babylonia areolata TaxID=304850 RepID=UPI003FD1B690